MSIFAVNTEHAKREDRRLRTEKWWDRKMGKRKWTSVFPDRGPPSAALPRPAEFLPSFRLPYLPYPKEWKALFSPRFVGLDQERYQSCGYSDVCHTVDKIGWKTENDFVLGKVGNEPPIGISRARNTRRGKDRKIDDRKMMHFIFLPSIFLSSLFPGRPPVCREMRIRCRPSVLYMRHTLRMGKPCFPRSLSSVMKIDTRPVVKSGSLCVVENGRKACAKLKFRQVRQLPPHR